MRVFTAGDEFEHLCYVTVESRGFHEGVEMCCSLNDSQLARPLNADAMQAIASSMLVSHMIVSTSHQITCLPQTYCIRIV